MARTCVVTNTDGTLLERTTVPWQESLLVAVLAAGAAIAGSALAFALAALTLRQRSAAVGKRG